MLLDGVPLNDPFGGWVAWTKLPRDGAWRAEIVPGGGATAWGNAALGGVVQILTAPEPFSPLQANAPTARLSASVGSFGTREAEFSTTAPTGAGEARLLGRAFATDGYSLVAPERRGAIDTPAWTVDLRTTFASLAGAEASLTDGADLSPLLLRGEKPPARAFYWPFPGYGCQEAVREGDWKIVRTGMAQRKRGWTDDEGWKLFDLARDPQETTDVAAEHPDLVERLAAIATREFTPDDAFPQWRGE